MLEKINSPDDLKKLKEDQLPTLALEMRKFLIDTISRVGGHFAANLGVVELAIALHYCFDSPRDKILWDVGHQSYPHKILTGRKNLMDTIRQHGGISGFPSIFESEHDVVTAGHAGSSMATAAGLAIARDRSGEDFFVVPVIGDGSMTSGIALEGLNQIGYMETDIIVVLNDNRMSISPNVGAFSEYTHRIMKTELYKNIRRDVTKLLEIAPKLGIEELAFQIKEHAKLIGTPGLLFEKLGYNYLGPVDGHNIPELLEAINRAKGIRGPVFMHVFTEKGKGYIFAEEDRPAFHGVEPFNKLNGKKLSPDSKKTYTKVFAETLISLAQKDDKIIGITAAMPDGTGLAEFKKNFPDRFFDVGIAEQYAVQFGVGLARLGYKPVVAIYSTFLQRAFDQLIQEVALMKLPVVFAMDRGGLVGEDGPTHHGVFDLSYLRCIPNFTIMAPKDEEELKNMLYTALNNRSGPTAIRYPRGCVVGIDASEKFQNIPLGKAEVLREGSDIVLLGVGPMVYMLLDLAEKLKAEGISATVINARFIKPIDPLIGKVIDKVGKALIMEENVILGGFGSAILEHLNVFAKKIKIQDIKLKGIPDTFIMHGNTQKLKEELGLCLNQLYNEVKLLLGSVTSKKNIHRIINT
ncbi:MAG: 1-deoxy-D-xylulose-5-phosphate synthase [Caldithrix sp. RBG_13_44_9]|nr:MAG: 1-deoxy-D-xylulose-5-phosphate synthase [Caldithrix sp. RBG_13_44_9]